MVNVSTGEARLPDEKLIHINVLELKATFLVLNSITSKWEHHIEWNITTKFKNFGVSN